MRKVLLILVLLISTMCSAANYTAIGFAHKSEFTNYQWSVWERCNIKVFVSDDTNHIEIYSKDPQVIDYGQLKEISTSEYTTFEGQGTDSNYKVINIQFVFWNNGTKSIVIEYSDVQYTYQIQ